MRGMHSSRCSPSGSSSSVKHAPGEAGPFHASSGSSDTAVGCDDGSVLRALAACILVHIRAKCPHEPGSDQPAWHGRRPRTHRPSPGPPHRVGEAGLVGVGGRLHGNPCVMAAYRCHTAHPGPAEVVQATNYVHLGSVGGSRARLPATWAERAAHGTQATRQCARATFATGSRAASRDAHGVRARRHVRTSCIELREAAYRSGCDL